MSAKLDGRFRAKLVAELTDSLRTADLYPSDQREIRLFSSLYNCDPLFKNRNKENVLYEQYIGHLPFIRFALDRILRLLAVATLPAALPVPLSEIAPFDDPSSIAELIVSEFEELPHRLVITCPLSKEVGSLIGGLTQPISVLNKLVIIPNAEHLKEYSYTHGDGRLVGDFPLSLLMADDAVSRWEQDRSYIQVFFEGFADRGGTSESISEALTILRSFFGLLAAVNVLEHVGFSPLDVQRFTRLPVHLKMSKWLLASVPLAEREFLDVLHGLRPTQWLKEKLDKEGLVTLFQFINFVGQCLRETDLHGRLQLAGRWYFDSIGPSDNVSRILRTAICLEVLYGKSNAEDEGGITELISSRIAYSIAENAQERMKIQSDTRAFYRLRSKIVHNGHVRPRWDEYSTFLNVQNYVKRAIFHEVKLVWTTDPVVSHLQIDAPG